MRDNEAYVKKMKTRYDSYLKEVKHQMEEEKIRKRRLEDEDKKQDAQRLKEDGLLSKAGEQQRKHLEDYRRKLLDTLKQDEAEKKQKKEAAKRAEDARDREMLEEHEEQVKIRNKDHLHRKKMLEQQMKDALKIQMMINEDKKVLKKIEDV